MFAAAGWFSNSVIFELMETKQTPENLRTRLAPTPSGLLHPGNGLSFIVTWAMARAAGGQVLLRIDDLDKARRREEYVEDVFRTLEWLGLDYDEGPSGVADFYANWSQQHRLDVYERGLEQLKAAGQLFVCRCSRKEIRAIAPDGRYPGTCLELELPYDSPQTAWRVQAPVAGQSVRMQVWEEGEKQFPLSSLDAFVLRRKDGAPAYQLASLMDDLRFGINFIVRGQDLFESSLAQLYLAHLLEAPAFAQAVFWHHPLLRDASGKKLSKSQGAGSLREWREEGRSPYELYLMAEQQLAAAEAQAAVAVLEQLRK